jgi:hypothetical protein
MRQHKGKVKPPPAKWSRQKMWAASIAAIDF